MAREAGSTTSAPEAELVRRAQAGDTSSFDQLVEAHYSAVYSAAYRMLNDPSSASDATQTAFIRAFEALASFRGASAFGTWLYRIVMNVCLDELRKRRHQPVSLVPDDDEEDSLEERDIPDDSDEPGLLAEQRERQGIVQEAISRLPEDYRAIIVLYDIRGFSYQEIGAMLDIPLGTVKSRLNRARNALRDEMAPYLELFR